MTFGTLFSGIAGWDLGMIRAGMDHRWMVEKDPHCRRLLSARFPGVPIHEDARTFDPAEAVDVLCASDPCQSRSGPSAIHGTAAADLWPAVLRAVQLVRPLWVCRENVPSPDVDRCALDLVRLGYSPVVVEMDGAEVTGQSRPREFLCGVLAASRVCPARVLSGPQGPRRDPATVPEKGHVAACLTTHAQRFDAGDNYIVEPGRGVRILASVERERLMGFDDGWTAGFSDTRRARFLGNSLIVPEAEWIGRRIMEASEAVK